MQLPEMIDLARRLYGRVQARDYRSHQAIRMLVGMLALIVREARRDPAVTNELCRKLGIRATRLEVRSTRLVSGRRIQNRSDQIHRWANAAAYLARPPNGDEPPPMWRDAIRYLNRRGGVRSLSDLYAAWRTNPTMARSLEENVGFKLYYRKAEADSTVEWYTPKYIFDLLGCVFDLDPAGSDYAPWIPAKHYYTSGGLEREWFGFCWLNPPFGKDELPLWTEKFARHGNGIILVPERTSTGWWQALVPRADLVLALNKKIPFMTPTGEPSTTFPIGTHLVAIGEQGVAGLLRGHQNGLGILLKPVSAAEFHIAAERATKFCELRRSFAAE